MWCPALPSQDAQSGLPDDSWLKRVTVVPFEKGSGVKILGIPINPPGDQGFVRDTLESSVAKQEEACRALGNLRDPQLQHHLLRACFDACKLLFLLRGADCLSHNDLLLRSDQSVRATLDRITDVRSSDSQWEQACLPLRHGGAAPPERH